MVSMAGTFNKCDDEDANPFGFGTQVGYELPINDDFSFEPYIGYDMEIPLANDFTVQSVEYELATGITMYWPGSRGWAPGQLYMNANYGPGDGVSFPGMSLGYRLAGDTAAEAAPPEHNLRFSLKEDVADNGVLYGFGSELLVDWFNFTSEQSELYMSGYLDYTMVNFGGGSGAFRPGLFMLFDNYYDEVAGRQSDLLLGLRASFLDVIPNTEFGIDWRSGSLIQGDSESGDPVWGFLKAYFQINA